MVHGRFDSGRSTNFNLINMNIYEIYSKQLESNVQKLNTELRDLKKQIIKKEPETEVEAELHAKVEWSNLFMNYIYEENKDLYNTAVEYADNNQFKI